MANAKFYDKDKADSLLLAKRDRTDNTCHATTSGFSPWFATPPSGYTFGEAQPEFDSTSSTWKWYVEGSGVSANAESGASTESAASATFSFTDSGETKTFTATRFAAVESTADENFVTKSYVASQFSSGNTALMAAVDYTLKTAQVALDHTVQYFSTDTGFTLTAPTAVTEGTTAKATDMVVYVTNTATDAITVALDTSVEWHFDGTDSGLSLPKSAFSAIYVSEIGLNADGKRMFVAKVWTPGKSQAVSA